MFSFWYKGNKMIVQTKGLRLRWDKALWEQTSEKKKKKTTQIEVKQQAFTDSLLVEVCWKIK